MGSMPADRAHLQVATKAASFTGRRSAAASFMLESNEGRMSPTIARSANAGIQASACTEHLMEAVR